MFVYGDCGQFTFDSMTWLGTVYNLEYDNIGYQMEKLSYDSKQALYVFDDDACREDILKWLKDSLEQRYEISSENISKVIDWIKNEDFLYSEDVYEFWGKQL